MARDPTSPRRMLEFTLTYAHGLLASASVGIMSFYYAQISAEYSLGVIAGSVVISIFSLCGAVGGVIAGWYLARTDLYRSLSIGSILLALSSLGAVAPFGAAGFFAMRVIASLGFIIVVTVVP